MDAPSAVEHTLQVVADREPVLRAWAALDEDKARAEGHRAPAGVLSGLTLGVKDIFDTADLPTEYGSPIYAGFQPRSDAAAVALLRAAGAMLIGKTVTTEFAWSTPAETTNPHRSAHTPGGSSSGSAAAVAAGMVDLAIGTQTAGSVIRPASFCGVFALKPTFGLIPTAGMKPAAPSLDTVGVFAADLGVLDVIRPADYDDVLLRAAFGRSAQVIDELFADVDVLVTPAATGEAPEGLGFTGDPRFCRLWTLLGLPALTVPGSVGASGMPIGVQLIARPRAEDVLIQAGYELAAKLA
jgi:Asp-tRNA(Asn)/Glu-tRNA(Gln) amidotransferase A subunit family amidase